MYQLLSTLIKDDDFAKIGGLESLSRQQLKKYPHWWLGSQSHYVVPISPAAAHEAGASTLKAYLVAGFRFYVVDGQPPRVYIYRPVRRTSLRQPTYRALRALLPANQVYTPGVAEINAMRGPEGLLYPPMRGAEALAPPKPAMDKFMASTMHHIHRASTLSNLGLMGYTGRIIYKPLRVLPVECVLCPQSRETLARLCHGQAKHLIAKCNTAYQPRYAVLAMYYRYLLRAIASPAGRSDKTIPIYLPKTHDARIVWPNAWQAANASAAPALLAPATELYAAITALTGDGREAVYAGHVTALFNSILENLKKSLDKPLTM